MSSMIKFAPMTVYENIILMLKYRAIDMTSEVLSMNKFIDTLNNYEYVVITGVRKETDTRTAANVRVVLIAPNSRFATKAPDFKKMYKAILKDAPDMNELLFVSSDAFTVHIKKAIIEIKSTSNILIEDYTYRFFMLEVPKHVQVPQHTIVSGGEVEQFCDYFYTTKERFQDIVSGDPIAVWLGLRPTNVVKIERLSETAGNAIAYRHCKVGSVEKKK